MEVWLAEGDAWKLLSALLKARYGLPALPRVARQEGGKPCFPEHPQLHFNLSHSAGLALCAVGEAPLGVDVERVRPRRPGLAEYALSPEEYRWYQAGGGGWERFYTLWTLKEARVKCTGQGLRQLAREISVPLLEPGEAGELDGLYFRAWAGPGWRGAACCRPPERPPETLRENVSFS